jgi:hypothetical protein
MKELQKPLVKNREGIIEYMTNRHGNEFLECFENDTLNKDYSKCPTQVLMKHSIPESLIDEIKQYNEKYGTNFGYSCSSLFALIQKSVNKKGQPVYDEKFQLCQNNDGINILKSFFDCIISKNKMRSNTVMKEIEKTQTSRDSRISTEKNPLLFIVYLPVNTRNNTISLLQKTFKKFLEENELWDEYNIEYSNSNDNSNSINEKDYNKEIGDYMKKTKEENKRGCILLLGNKGSVGITYKDCDVTISLDDGHNLDNQKQRYARSLTEQEGKTIGINVDMNIQRSYLYLIDVIQKHRKNTKTNKTHAEILYYLFEHNIFLFDPHKINNGKMKTIEIMSYYQKEIENIMKAIDDTPFLENLICDDKMRDFIKIDYIKSGVFKQPTCKFMEGEQQDCPKGDKTGFQMDSPERGDADSDTDANADVDDSNVIDEETNVKIETLINKTFEMCKSFLFPLLALFSRTYKIFDFKEIFTNPQTGPLIISLLKDKIELNKDNYIYIVNIMNNIIDNNSEIVNNIREIYSIAPYHKLRQLIEKHFIPTIEEQKDNAEIPTPVTLVDFMLDLIPLEFWKTPKKIFEPCCGKGNFILGIVKKFDEGLKELYPDNEERIRIIMTECIYYADLTALNVFITTELLRCEFESICGVDEIDFEFNNHIGDTLKLDIKEKWGVDGFDAVCGNPPYNDRTGNKGKGHTLWTRFIENALNDWLSVNGYLLFVNPGVWRQPEHPLQQLMKSKQIVYLEIHDEKDGLKTFKKNTRYDIYLIQNKDYELPTTIKTQKGEIENIDLREWDFIPNYNFKKIRDLITSDDKINMLYSRSAYASEKKWMSKTKTETFKYPVVYSVNRANEPKFIWSDNMDKPGHYGFKKVIFGSGATGFIIDKSGEYACSEFCTGIIDDNLENLEIIKNVLNSERFKDIILATSVSKAEINRKVLKYFKKDFWKDFM